MTPDSSFDASSGFMPGHTLPPGTKLHDYRIEHVLGEGGFGIVYLAFDLALERRVAIKEYLPSSMAARASAGMTVVVKSPSHAATFAVGLRSFVNEARLLARFDHPALVKVHQFWEDNGTAYMVMPYYEGPTLRTALAQLGRLPTEAEVRRWLMPLMDALAVLHAENCYHRDIAPDNILITAGGPLLLDFGAARRVIGDLTHALTAVLKPGYAPIEQYGEMPGMGQGPWTDIFALASVLYVAVSGVRPVPSVERLMDDRMKPLSRIAAGRCRPGFLAAVDKALSLRPEDRPLSVAEFRALLDADGAAQVPAPQPLPATIVGAPPPHEGDLVDIGLDLIGPRPDVASPPPMPAQMPAPMPAPMPRPPSTPRPMPQIRPPPLADDGADVTAPDGRGGVAGRSSRQRRVAILALAAGGAAAAGWGAYRAFDSLGPGRGGTAPSPAPTTPPTPTPAPRRVPPPATPTPAPTPAPSTAPTRAPTPAPTRAPTPAPTRAPTRAPTPAPTRAPTPAPTRAPTPAPAASRAERRPANTQAEQARAREVQAQCSAILQKASLGTLTRDEVEFLRRECR